MTRRGKMALVLLFFCICGTAALTSHYLERRAGPPPPSILYSIIFQQMQALQRNDFNTAYQQVALDVQRKFTVAQFADLVRQEYGNLVYAKRLEFGRVDLRENRAYIEVFFIEQRGIVQPCIFRLGNDSGTWKIEGARLMPRWPKGRVLSGVQA
jgi:MoaA/NifB/PqqE/SkfB family radical SAM enzyme